ncbi:MAG: 23S rRNA (guanosine(2251)-2'-O)-methyltransferase RlmB [Micropepsaceae bacterium]
MTRRNRGRGPEPRKESGGIWLWGTHAVRAALANPARKSRKLLVSGSLEAEFRAIAAKSKVPVETADHSAIDRALPREAVHQGVALLTNALGEADIHDAIEGVPAPRRLVLLDQVTDPHNLGAILRSAAAFSVCGVVVQDRNSPPEGGVLAKAASGALELVPVVRVVNIARTLDELGELGFLRVALADEAAEPIEQADLGGDVVLALGAEGEGLRRLTREKCDIAVRLPTQGQMPSLNVSNAAAVALYACATAKRG